MKRVFLLLALMLFVVAAAAGCGGTAEQPKTNAEPVNLTVSAAASLQDATEELKSIYEAKHSNVTLTFNLASSGALQKQIEEGAPADLFISAGKPQMDALAGKGLIVDASRQDLLGNELVLIAGKDSKITGFEDLAGAGKISIGTPETVPAGKYAQQALISLKLWDKLQSKIVQAKDVRQVLTYVEIGNADAGLVYRTDAIAGKDINIVTAAPEGSYEPIVYPMAMIKSTKHQKETEAFAAFLKSEAAVKVFEKYGFKVLQ